MCFVLEKKKPRLGSAVNVNRDLYGAGIDLLGLVKLIKLTELL